MERRQHRRVANEGVSIVTLSACRDFHARATVGDATREDAALRSWSPLRAPSKSILVRGRLDRRKVDHPLHLLGEEQLARGHS